MRESRTSGLAGGAGSNFPAPTPITDARGQLQGWLNELAIVPVDYNPAAVPDEWSGDHGSGVPYFSRQAVSRLMPLAGIRVARKKPLLERLEWVAALLQRGDSRAVKIYESIQRQRDRPFM